MNWEKETINDLKNYVPRLHAIENISGRIRMLEEEYISLRNISTDTPVMGGISKQEANLINNIVAREKLKSNLKIVRTSVKLIEKGLSILDERQRAILEGFYINRVNNHIEVLCDRFNIEQARLYQIKNEALYKVTISMYGIVDL